MRGSAVAATATLLLLALTPTASADKCDSRDVSEAETSFKNCVESAQTGVMQRVSAADADDVDMCDSLDNMLVVCQQQKERLAECKGQAHAQTISELHLSVTANIVAQLNPRANVEKCAVFTQKKARPVHDNSAGHGGGTLGSRNKHDAASAEAEGYGVGTAAAGASLPSSLLGMLLLISTIVRFWTDE